MSQYRLPADMRISAVTLRVQNFDRAKAFYADLLGFTASHIEKDVLALAPAADADPILYLVEVPNAIPKPGRTIGLYHVAILLSSRSQLGKVIFRLLTEHYPLQGASDHIVSEALYLSDPDGNGLEIYRDRPRPDWKFEAEGVAMATLPMDMEGVLREADTSAYNGIDPLTQIGHIHLHVSDLKRAEAFYVDALGFDVMQRSYPGALFVSAGGYHHHMGLNTWAGHRPPPPNAVGIDSFTLALPGGIDDAVKSLRDHGVEVHTHGDHAHLRDQDGNALLLSSA